MPTSSCLKPIPPTEAADTCRALQALDALTAIETLEEQVHSSRLVVTELNNQISILKGDLYHCQANAGVTSLMLFEYKMKTILKEEENNRNGIIDFWLTTTTQLKQDIEKLQLIQNINNYHQQHINLLSDEESLRREIEINFMSVIFINYKNMISGSEIILKTENDDAKRLQFDTSKYEIESQKITIQDLRQQLHQSKINNKHHLNSIDGFRSEILISKLTFEESQSRQLLYRRACDELIRIQQNAIRFMTLRQRIGGPNEGQEGSSISGRNFYSDLSSELSSCGRSVGRHSSEVFGSSKRIEELSKTAVLPVELLSSNQRSYHCSDNNVIGESSRYRPFSQWTSQYSSSISSTRSVQSDIAAPPPSRRLSSASTYFG